MIAINIISAAGNNTTINVREGITIQKLKGKYAISQGAGLDENDFEFISGNQILDNKTKLNELLKDNEELELNITSTRRHLARANCFREINNLSSSNNIRKVLQSLSAILTTNISEEEGISILASSDSQIVLAAAQKNRLALRGASKELKNNKAIILAAVQQDGWALAFASEELKNDIEIVLAAVQQNGLALLYASEELKDHSDIVLAAVQQNGDALQYASPKLKNDREILEIKKDLIKLKAPICPVNEKERGQPSTSSSSRSSQAYPTRNIRSL